MNKLSIVIVANNEKEYVKMTIQSIRMFGVDNISVILVDNASTDGLNEWAMTQQDLTYAYIDDGKKYFGKVINDVMTELKPEGDLLILRGHYLLTPGSIESMLEVLHEVEDVGIVGPLSNGFCDAQELIEVNNWQEAIDMANTFPVTRSKYTIGVNEGIILLKEKMLKKLNEFDETLKNDQYVVKDYCIKTILNKWKIKICETAILGICMNL